MYIPVVGGAFFVLVSSYLACFDSAEFSVRALKRTVGIMLLLFMAHTAGTYLLTKPTLDGQTVLEHASQNGYSFIYAGLAIMFKKVRVVFFAIIAYTAAAAACHRARAAVVDVMYHADLNMTGTARVSF